MTEIKVLSPKTVNQIAAGEVIERPASVVKELVENSIDAGADEIKIDVENGGKDLIYVKDNGSGMSGDEVELAFKKHATSKIEQIEDLDDLSSLGFRGEALPSIASVSKVKAQTRRKDDLEGTEISIHGGDIKKVIETGCPAGTIIEVKDLFYNTPARRKFLKKTSTELSHISEVVTRMSLANPEVQFTLNHNDNELFFVPKTNSPLENIKSVYGKEVAKKMVEVSAENEAVSVEGYVSKPEVTRSNRRHIFNFVNSRFVDNTMLKDAVVEGFGTLLKKRRYPIAVLFLEIDGDRIDVNVHPTKTNIRFYDEGEIKEEVSRAIHSSLLREDLVPSVSSEESGADTEPVEGDVGRDLEGSKEMDMETSSPIKGIQKTLGLKEEREVSESKLSRMTIAGIVKDTYIITETPKGMAVIDQHAAHERINYEKLKNKYDDKIESQKLVSPVTIELKPRESAVLRANEKLLEELGFEIEHFGRTTFRIEGVPVVLGELQEKEIIHSVLDELMDNKKNSLEERKEEMIRYMACRSSLMAGDRLSISRGKRLLEELGKTENPYTCPHGRPTIVTFEEKSIEKWFKRD